MQAAPHNCPHCRDPLWIHNDMWGPYYLCEDCGWTAEDDDEIAAPSSLASGESLPFLTIGEAYRQWQTGQRRWT